MLADEYHKKQSAKILSVLFYFLNFNFVLFLASP